MRRTFLARLQTMAQGAAHEGRPKHAPPWRGLREGSKRNIAKLTYQDWHEWT
ncbi:MAG: hypothetical protein AVDCRST_MAG15-1206 [uncultured Rubellimicrobium sp.]|uniref:Uncharacterized protein n=1 Tax=uncultured Rubellimicrobium sp. TaxID=543078 RepID=A0A6J4PA30_9RHOB|nr:MAG: hypothetical protein AVDCRST_MAG15-1206 [uncultured Rubellimicrobium sp.]